MTLSQRSLVGLAALAVVCFLVSAAEQPPKDKDPQNTVEPRSGPGVGQKFLEKFVGEWEVVKSFHPRNGGDPSVQKGSCRQTMIQEGRFLQSDFVFGLDDKKTTGVGLIGFETDSGKFTSVWIDSRSTKMSIRQSEDKFNGDEIVLYSKSLKTDDKEERRTRTVTRLEDDGRKIVHRQYNPTPDGKERLLMELVLTRKAGK